MTSPAPTAPPPAPGAAPTDPRWHAVLERDRASDGRFVYAVRSTGIYCRPSCPSRRPRPDRVAFFAHGAAARAAGFRACRRCAPDTPRPGSAAADPRLLAVCHSIEARVEAGERPTLAELGREAGWSPAHLQRVFKRALGASPREWTERLRTERLKAALGRGEPILDSIYGAGFGSTSRVYEDVGARLGMTPGTWRRGGAGLAVRHARVETPLGWLLVGATPRGICHVALGRSPRTLERELRGALPEATLEGDDPELQRWVGALAQWIAGERPWPELPVDVRGSAFQLRVWQALREIPEGETRTYGELARGLGRPTAARAVARACATNPAALAIPCHRVVPAASGAGGAGGYRHGRERKLALLEREAATPRRRRKGRPGPND